MTVEKRPNCGNFYSSSNFIETSKAANANFHKIVDLVSGTLTVKARVFLSLLITLI